MTAPPLFCSGPHRRLSWTTRRIPAWSTLWWRKRLDFSEDRRTEELILSSPDSRAHKRIDRGACNFDNAICESVREDAVLAGSFTKFSQNPATKQYLLSIGTKLLAEASPFDPMWGIGLRSDDPEAGTPRLWPGKISLGKKLFLPSAAPFVQARPGWQTTPPLINSPLRPRATKFMRFPHRLLALWLWSALA